MKNNYIYSILLLTNAKTDVYLKIITAEDPRKFFINKRRKSGRKGLIMQDEVLTITKNGYTLTVWKDEFPINPREEFDNLGTLYVPRPPRGYSFSDEGANAEDADSAPVKIPVYVLDHSGIAVRDTPFGDPWDSWQAGVYYVTAERLKKEYADRSYEEAEKTALSLLRAELQEFTDYIAGDVYGFTITDDRDGKELETVGGYFGEDGIQQIKSEFPGYVTTFEAAEYPLFAFAGLENVWRGCSPATQSV